MIELKDVISIGVDIGGSATKMSLLHGEEEVVLRGEFRSRPGLAQLGDELSEMLDVLLGMSGGGLNREDINAVGVSLAGPVNADGVLEHASNIPAMKGLMIGDWLPGVLGVDLEALALTDALSAALCEHQRNPVAGRAIYLSMGTGVGGAVLDDGIPLVITRGTPGHFGHLDVSGGEDDAPMIVGSGRGSLEAYVGANMLRQAGVPLEDPEACLEHDRMQMALGGLSRGIRILLAIYRPNYIYLMGGMSMVFEPTLPLLRTMIADGLTPAAPEQWVVERAESGPFAASIGAASVAQAKVLRNCMKHDGMSETEIRIQQASKRKAVDA
ncbi:D-allose kinase [Poriferisphaera corsica]|uniref:D-allose kinase n=1 Tax=Poriferisphaera corsica TaxID=2528020 RepID=A0A517YYF8_9BACT|nr:ROK family protein [Poriferisphaera corsica]QDU35256.1 D-allose kinase [Poriferisphaera corsica]